MTAMVLRRLIQLPIIVGIIYTITLSLAWGIPGNPLENPEGRQPPPAVRQAMLEQYKLDSFPRFYFSYLHSASGLAWAQNRLKGADRDEVLHRAHIFDLGPSLKYEDWSVNEIIAGSLPISVTLGSVAILLALALGTAAGVIGAVRPNSFWDLSTLSIALIGISLPSFVIGTVLLLIFSVWLAVLPVAEWGHVRALILPAVTLSLPFAAYIARLTRMGMLEHLGADYIRTARAKGLAESRVLLKHALKNAFLPVLSYLGPAAALAMTGSFIVERVFNVPGMGQHFVNAVQNKDLFLIMGVVLIFATMLILFNLAVDVMYRWVDPRIE
jgi:oligopeptide transport system permease protein